MTKNPKIIRGAGGPPPPPKPFRAPDTLHSRQFATVQDLISEGEIEGFASPSKAGITDRTSTAYNNAALKDVFLNDTPILNQSADNNNPANSDFNFLDVTFRARFGLGTQSIMRGIPTETRRPIAVSTADVLQSGNGVVKAVANQCDAVIVTLTWAQIQKSEDNGDIHGSTVQYKISVQPSGGAYEERVNTSVKGRTADSYSRDHRLEMVDASGTPLNFPVNVKVERITADASAAGFLRDEFKFSFIQEVIETTNTYNNSAYVGLRVDSKIFNAIPKRTFRVRGIKVRIPGAGANNSGTPTVDLQTGRIIYPDNYIFNGTMQSAKWCSCPAMILLDLLTTKRYGLGDHIASDQTNDSTTYSNIDLFSFFAASKYSNELVLDGTAAGTKEARFSCNVNIQSPKEAYTAINELAGVMRCMPIWSAGTINISQDQETTASYLFNLANVGEGGFNYQGSSLKQRHSVISVSYFNMDSKEIDFEVVEDDAAIAKLGTIVKQVKAFACTSRGQAARLGRAILFAEQNESETVTFTTSIDSGMLVRPGAVIEINDPVRAGARRGGRVVAATTSSITIDSASSTLLTHSDGQGTLSGPGIAGNSPTISVILPDGTVETKTIEAESSGVLTLDSALSAAPNVNSPYLISSTTLATQQFRVIQVEEQDDINYVITALTYVNGKYKFIEEGKPLPTRNISLLNNPVNPPSNLTATETTIVINGIARSRLLISWKQPTETIFAINGESYSRPQGVSSYQLNYRIVSEDGNANNFITQEVSSNDFEIMDTKKGSVDIEVYSYSASGKLSTNPVTAIIQTSGKSGSPDNVTGLTIEPINEQLLRLRFNQSTSVDVLHGGRVYVRHSNLSETLATFQSAQDVVEAVPGNANDVICPALAGTYLLKFQDDTGNFSETAAKVTSSLVDIIDSITVKEDREDTDSTPYNGNKGFVNYDSTQGGLILTNPVNNSIGEYHFVNSLDLGGVFSVNLQRHFQGVGFYSGVNFDSRTENIDTWLNFDGTEAPNANAKMQVATTDLDPAQALTARYVLSGLGNKGLIGIVTTDSNGNAIAHNLTAGDTIFLSITNGLGTNFPDMNRDYVVDQVISTSIFRVLSDNQFGVTSAAADCTISNKFKQFNDIASGSVKGRGFRFKIQLTTTDTAQNMNLQQAGYKATMAARTEQSSKITSGLGAKVETFTKPFFVGTSGLGNLNNFLPSVNISPQNMATGDYFVLSNISGTGFTVHFKDSNDANISRDFTYTAAGFGKGE